MAEGGAEEAGPRLGSYVGKQRDCSCPGDHVTWEIVLVEGGTCSIECSSELSLSKGGLQHWRVEGTWEWDGDEEEVTIDVVKDDPLGGPKRERELTLPRGDDGSLTFKFAGREVACAWEKPPPDTIQDELEAMPIKELKAVALASGLDPQGCIEKGDFLRILARARASGSTINLHPPPSPPPPASSPSASPPPGASPAASGSPAAASPPPGSSPASSSGGAAPSAGAALPAARVPVAGAAAPAAAPAAKAEAPAAPEEPEEGCYTLEQLTDKRVWEKLPDVKSTERETYLPTSVFLQLFGMPKAEFAKLPKWKRDNIKKKHELF